MKKLIMFLGLIIMTAGVANASVNVPRCWADDKEGIQDGAYKVTVSTKSLSAKDYAKILSSTLNSNAMIQYNGDGSDLSFETIDMGFQAETADQWKELTENHEGAVSFESIQSDILTYLKSLSQMKGVVAIECVPQLIHSGSASLSN